MLGIDELRKAVALFNACNEEANQRFGATELLAIYRAHKASGWDIYPDQWTIDQLEAACLGVVPDWDDDGKPIEGGKP